MRDGVDERETRPWHGTEVDAELKESWLERLNSIPGVRIWSTCAGHPERLPDGPPAPYINFYPPSEREAEDLQEFLGDLGNVELIWDRARSRSIVSIESSQPKADMSEREFNQWWEAVVGRLEALADPNQSAERPDVEAYKVGPFRVEAVTTRPRETIWFERYIRIIAPDGRVYQSPPFEFHRIEHTSQVFEDLWRAAADPEGFRREFDLIAKQNLTRASKYLAAAQEAIAFARGLQVEFESALGILEYGGWEGGF